MARGCHAAVSAPPARWMSRAMLTMTTRRDGGGDGTQKLLWISGSKVSEFEL
jgi:hypothetical protein